MFVAQAFRPASLRREADLKVCATPMLERPKDTKDTKDTKERMMRMALFGAAVMMAGAVTGCAKADPAPAAPVELAVDGRSNAHLSLAADGRRVAAAWIASSDAGADVFTAVSEDGGRTFGAPVRVNDVAGDAGGNGEQPPRVVLKKGAIAVVWVSKRQGVAGIRAARSTDGGRTFPAARTISPDGVTGARGWESAAIDDAGVIHAAWLDGRHASPSPAVTRPASAEQAQPSPAAARPAVAPKPDASAGGAKHVHGAGHAPMRQDIVHAMWRDGEAIVETPVADNVCFCCKTGVAAHGSDVFVVWRHLFPGGVRDIAIARSADSGRTFGAPVRVSADDWKIDACPDDGPALAIDGGGAIYVAWPTLLQGASPHMAIFETVSRDGGATFSPRTRVDASETGASHPRIAVSGSGARSIVWDEIAAEGRRVMYRGAGAAVPLAEGGSASYPAIAAAGDGFVVAWTEQAAGRSVVRVVSAPR